MRYGGLSGSTLGCLAPSYGVGHAGNLALVKQKKAGRQQWRMMSFNDLVTALEHLLPRRQLTTEDLADIIGKRHDLRRKAKKSDSRRSQVALE